MKNMKRIVTLILALQLAVGCVCSGYAEEPLFTEDGFLEESNDCFSDQDEAEGLESVSTGSEVLISEMSDQPEDLMFETSNKPKDLMLEMPGQQKDSEPEDMDIEDPELEGAALEDLFIGDEAVEDMTESFDDPYEEEIYEEEITEGFIEAVELIETIDEEQQSLAAGEYTYTIRPMLEPFNRFFYVETDDPDPTAFRFVDKDSRLLNEKPYDRGVCKFWEERFLDVVYENEASGRVKGGYIFYNPNCDLDGGELILQRKIGYGEWEDTPQTVICPQVVNTYRYLIDTYTNSSMSFFDKLAAVSNALKDLAVYPRLIRDPSQPSNRPYPFLAVSRYWERSLNRHYEFYKISDKGVLAFDLYPFVLDSLSYPGTIRRVAEMLDSSCSTEAADVHFAVRISLGGETRAYGGSGKGDGDPLYTNQVGEKRFFFDGRNADLAVAADLNDLKLNYLAYGEVADQNKANFKDQVEGDEFARAIGPGTWVRVAVEGSSGEDYGYIAYGPGGTPFIASSCWVDGRYIDQYECLEMNTSFAEHPTSSIILRNVHYTDKNGKEHTNDIIYKYSSNTDTWQAPLYYDDKTYSTSLTIPDQFILTREQVEKMQLDGNTSHVPEAGKIYDGKAYPGTEFGNVLLQGISLPESITILAGENVNIPVEYTPSNTSETEVDWTSGDESVLHISWQKNTIWGIKEGQTVLTGVSVDGGFGASCIVNVKQRKIKIRDDKQVTVRESVTPGTKLSYVYASDAFFEDVKTGETVYGSFKYDEPDSVLSEGMHHVSWTFTPYQEVYETMHGTLTIKVEEDPNSWYFPAYDEDDEEGDDDWPSHWYDFAGKKKTQPMQVTAKNVTVKYKKLKKKNQTVQMKKAFTVKGSKGKITFQKVSGNKKIRISKEGKIILKKGLKKKTYDVKVKVTAAGNSWYANGSRIVTLKIRVR